MECRECHDADSRALVSWEREQRHQMEAIAKDYAHTVVLRYWCAKRELLKLNRDPFYLSTGETVDIIDRNESVQTARNGYIYQSIATFLLKGIIYCGG